MLYIFEVVELNGKKIRKPYSKFVDNGYELRVEEERLSEERGCDVLCSTVQVKSRDEIGDVAGIKNWSYNS